MNPRASDATSIEGLWARRLSVALGAALLVLAATALAFALAFPALTGRVVDEAGLLDPAATTALERKLADFEAKTTGQFVVVTLKSLQGTSIEDFGYQLGRHWGVGQKDRNSGVLMIVAPNERKVRIEVGYGLEGQLTDAVAKLIIENSILPRFKAGDFPGGIARGVDDVIQVLTVDPEEWKARAKQRPDVQSAVIDIVLLALLAIVILIIVGNLARIGQGYPPNVRGRRGSWSGPVVIPGPGSWDAGGSSSGSSWSDSSGGFSGGGGSFGGGGASGSW